MKTSYTVFLLLFPAFGFAAGYGGAEGQNQLGERIYIASDSYYELYVIRGAGDGEWSKPYDMNAECPEFKSVMETGQAGTFSCPPGHNFPLSGATYRITTSNEYRPCDQEPYFDKSPGTVYVCVKGCNSKSVPAIFEENPWEC